MNELKTLKDLDLGIVLGSKGRIRCVNIPQLRQEAIKWVKQWNVWNLDEQKPTSFERENVMMCGLVGATGAFMSFFNLTEDDLK